MPASSFNNPMDTGDEKPFPIAQFRSKSHLDMRKVPILYYTASVDMAGTVNQGSDYSVILTVGWDQSGRGHVVDVRHGKYLPDALIAEIFDSFKRWRPRSIRIEETGYVRGLKTSIRRYEDLTGVYLPFIYIKADNQRSKQERILLTLQPWYKRGEIFFDESLPCLEHIKKELTSFPKGRTDDIIDALADQFQDKEWLGREQGSRYAGWPTVRIGSQGTTSSITLKRSSAHGRRAERARWKESENIGPCSTLAAMLMLASLTRPVACRMKVGERFYLCLNG